MDPWGGVGWSVICDIGSLLPLIFDGRRRPPTEADLPSKCPSSFALDFGTVGDVAASIDLAASKARANKTAAGIRREASGKTAGTGGIFDSSGWPLLLWMALSERGGLIVLGMVLGVVHGAVNSIGRFLLLRYSIEAVVEGWPLKQRAALASGVVLVLIFEALLLVVVKHLFSSHLAHYVGGRMSTLVLRKVGSAFWTLQEAQTTLKVLLNQIMCILQAHI